MSQKPRSRHGLIKDWHLWTDVTRTVTLLPSTTSFRQNDKVKARDQKTRVKTVTRKLRTEPVREMEPVRQAEPVKKMASAPSYSPPVSAPKSKSDGKLIEPRMRRRLMRGRLQINATLDLHGLRQHEAHAALSHFITARFNRGERTLLIITGKGMKTTGYGEIKERGVLRHMLPIWLGEPALSPLVAGWQTAAPGHGGEGAFYVRLKGPGR